MTEFARRFEKILWLFVGSLLFYLLSRTEFLIWNWAQYSSKPSMDVLKAFLMGLRFDLAASAMSLVPVTLWSLWPWRKTQWNLWRFGAFWLFIPFFIAFMIMNLGDVEFINFVGRRFTYDAWFIVNEIPGKVGAIFSTYALIFTVNILVMASFVLGARRILHRPSWLRESWFATGETQSLYPWLAYPFAVLLVIAVTVVAIRGGLQKKPMNIVNAHLFVAPVLNNLVLNSTFTFVNSFGAQTVSREVYFKSPEEMLKHLNGAAPAESLLTGQRAPHGQNVVVIILESFSLEYMGQVNGRKGFTPFLDSLAEKSLFFKNGFANGRRSIEGVAAVMAGIPAMMSEPFISSHFATNYFVGLGSMLSAHNYATSFFHGGNNGTMYFDSFAKSAGLDSYYGAIEYGHPEDNDGTWGIFDEPFLQFMKAKLDNTPKPFLASVFTLSSHNPYKIPPRYQGKFPTGPIEILQSVAYGDYSLKRFFEEAEKQPWYNDTLFVITADHTGLTYLPENDNELSRFRVPILFYHPKYQWPKGIDRDQVVQQIDILPSVMDFLGYENKEMNFLSRSVFVPGERTATLYLDGRYLLASKEHFLDWQVGGPIQMYSIKDPAQQGPLSEPAERKALLEQRLKASIQYFNQGMWDNRLYYPSGR
jgi:phosphoglycerol transferase MdoB-like AlkP superfamily enzyme